MNILILGHGKPGTTIFVFKVAAISATAAGPTEYAKHTSQLQSIKAFYKTNLKIE